MFLVALFCAQNVLVFTLFHKSHTKRKMDYTNLKEKMEKSISVYSEKLSEVRAGRANPAILNKIKIEK